MKDLDFTLSAKEWEDYEYIQSLSNTEKELYYIRKDYLDGKITKEESEILYKKYA